MSALPFNRVVVEENGRRRELTVGGFLALPIHDRVGLVLRRAVEFYKDRTLVDRQEALKHLRAYRPSG